MVESDSRADPSALRWLIGHELRSARQGAGKKQSDAAQLLGCVQSRINSLETAKVQQPPEEVKKLLRFYGADVDQVDRIVSLAARVDQSTWWAPFSDILPDWFRTFIGLEGLAAGQFVYESKLIPGQMQTAEYAAAVMEGHIRVKPRDVPQVVRAKMARQRVADDENPLNFRLVLEEHVLDRLVGGPAVMRPQLEHLLNLARRENVELHIMPISVAVHDGNDGDFVLLNFDQAQSIAYIEYPAGAIYVQDGDQIEEYKMIADRLCAAALSESDSIAAIQRRITSLSEEKK